MSLKVLYAWLVLEAQALFLAPGFYGLYLSGCSATAINRWASSQR
jgi:hypothetical protein